MLPDEVLSVHLSRHVGQQATASALTVGLMLPGSNDGCVWETDCVAKD